MTVTKVPGANKLQKMEDVNNVGTGNFSNIVNIALNPRDVFLDFGLAVPTSTESKEPQINLVSRIILSKDHAIEFSDILKKSLEQAYGEKTKS